MTAFGGDSKNHIGLFIGIQVRHLYDRRRHLLFGLIGSLLVSMCLRFKTDIVRLFDEGQQPAASSLDLNVMERPVW